MDTNKRIIIFSLTYDPFIGGAEVAVREITERLPDYTFDIVTLRLDPKLAKLERKGNVFIHRVGFTALRPLYSRSAINFPLSLNKYIFPWLALWKASSLYRKHKHGAIWAIMAAYAGFGALFFKLLHPKVPYILTLQEGDPIHHIKKRVRFIHPIWKLIFTKADIVQSISNYLASFAKDIGYRKEVEVIPNGVDLAVFCPTCPPYNTDHLKKELGKKVYSASSSVEKTPPDDVFLITTSRLVPKNGVKDIIDSIKYLPKHISLLVIGDGPLLEDLKLYIEEKLFDYSDQIKFLGSISHDKLPEYLRVADIFVRPSLSEGFGNSFVEAMAMGLPVIATPVGGIVDFIFDYGKIEEQTGFFCEPNNPKSIAKQVQRILSNKKVADRVALNAEKLAHLKYDWNIVAKDMRERIFERVIE